MSKVIRGGTVVTAERSYRADVLVEGETIAAIGEGLRGDEEVDASGAYVMPGGIDPHVHLEMPFMGTSSTDDFYTGTVAAASGGTTTVVDFCIPAPDGSMLSAWDEWAAKSKDKAVGDYAWHMCVTGWNERFFNEMEEVVRRGVNTFKHFMAYKGALDGERRRDVRVVLALRGAGGAAAGPCRERRRGGGACRRSCWPRGSPGRRGMRSRGRRRSKARRPIGRS